MERSRLEIKIFEWQRPPFSSEGNTLFFPWRHSAIMRFTSSISKNEFQKG
jgi:hypothetical protein